MPRVLIITGHGLNCEAESRQAWQRAGGDATCMHVNDLLSNPGQLHEYQALMFIGGFSYGDHMTSGHVFALRIRHRMKKDLERFISDQKLILGICNGFQTMTKLGLLPGLDNEYFEQKVALIQNDCGSFQDRWITLGFDPESPCIYTRGLKQMDMPVRHGEGKLFTLDLEILKRIDSEHLAPCRYIDPETGEPATRFPANPNGSLRSIAGLCDPTGRIFGMMPHPEAYLYPQNHPHWDLEIGNGAMQADGDGIKIFQNAVEYIYKYL